MAFISLFFEIWNGQTHFVDLYYPTIESTYVKSVVYKETEYDCHIIFSARQVMFSYFAFWPLKLHFFYLITMTGQKKNPYAYRASNSQYVIEIQGYILVYSITSKNSFNIMIQVVYDKIVNFCGVTKIPAS